MRGITPLWLFFGISQMLCAICLAFVKVDTAALSEKRHSNPGMALFRFPAWRWFVVALTFLFGVFFLAAGIGMVRL